MCDGYMSHKKSMKGKQTTWVYNDVLGEQPTSMIRSPAKALESAALVLIFSSSFNSWKMFMTQWKTALVGTLVLILNFEKVSAFPKSQILWFDVGPQIRNCRDVQRQGNTTSGIYLIFPYKCCPDVPLQVFCDMETDGGGWTVIQRRDDIEPRENFYRTWMEYSLGFGNLKGEFWLGNDNIHALTDQTLNEIRFDLADFKDNKRWANYKFFYVHDRSSSYKLEVVEYSGDTGDSFTVHSGMKFSAKDIDNDIHPSDSCSVM
ncbi:techylectin-5B-like [Macrobrachium nipponense]|uniref:techylectin-5B-like n=1 Tax=Macrobrachium nipponense TaxID=159736 RepID=UPI0030C8447B